MVPLQEQPAQDGTQDGSFWTTHWSEVLTAAQGDSSQAQESLAKLCQTYWYPLYVFVRRQGHSPEDAQDLVQGFFARLFEKQYLKLADPQKGRFRSFLLTALKRFMANEWDRAHRLKRGGGQQVISLDEQDTEARYQSQPADESPEKAYQRQWASTVLDQVLDRLEAEFSSTGRTNLFGELKVYLSGESASSSYSDIGHRIGMTEAAVKVAAHRLRERYRALLRIEIGKTVGSPAEIDDEIRDLFAAFS